MVKSIIYAAAATILCIAMFAFTQSYVESRFDEFHEALTELYKKTEDGEATKGDADAVRILWNDAKEKLHIFLPHNDISYIDYWLSEACGLLYGGETALALGKIEVLKEISKNLPKAYSISLENIF